MRTLITPEFTAEVEAIWQATQRAVRENRLHPLACAGHSAVCASQGCEVGLRISARAKARRDAS